MNRRVSAVIPLVPQHDRYLRDLLAQLVSDDQVLAKVVIARSSLKREDQDSFQAWLNQVRLEVRLEAEVSLTSIEGSARESPNRNRGWGQVDSEFTAFLDADDSYAPGRLTLLLSVAEEVEADLVLHGYVLESQQTRASLRKAAEDTSLQRVDAHQLRWETFATRNPFSNYMPFVTVEHTQVLIPSQYQNIGLHHAHAFVRTNLRNAVQYRDVFPGADGIFCQEVLATSEKVLYLPAALSVWNKSQSAYAQIEGTFGKRLGRLVRRTLLGLFPEKYR